MTRAALISTRIQRAWDGLHRLAAPLRDRPIVMLVALVALLSRIPGTH